MQQLFSGALDWLVMVCLFLEHFISLVVSGKKKDQGNNG